MSTEEKKMDVEAVAQKKEETAILEDDDDDFEDFEMDGNEYECKSDWDEDDFNDKVDLKQW